jgi:hypothetical protein
VDWSNMVQDKKWRALWIRNEGGKFLSIWGTGTCFLESVSQFDCRSQFKVCFVTSWSTQSHGLPTLYVKT